MSERVRIQRKREKATAFPSVQSETFQGDPTGLGHTVNEVPPIVQEVLSASGQPLDASTREFMEPRFGHDFSQVRVHTDERAVESAQAVNALAYTVGQDLVFGEGQYTPGTQEGKSLLAHELTHVVQQGNWPVVGRPMFSSSPSDSLERAASETASKVMAESQSSTRDVQEAFSTTAVPHSGITVQRFQAGGTGHGGIEEVALTGKATGLPAKLQFSFDEVSKIYLGNWLRDLSQLTQISPKTFHLVNILALGEFGREISRDELGTYVPSEHLDNPEGGGTVEDPKLSPEAFQKEYNQLSHEQQAAYTDEKAHMADIQNAAKASGLPIYIERGKYHAKQKLTEAIVKGRTSEGMQAMGNALHAVEDYYSHSNFVEVAIWWLHTNRQLSEAEYNNLVRTEAGNDTALLGSISVSQGGPEIITGTYAPGANSKVSQLELLCTEVEHGQLTKAFIKGSMLKMGITVEDLAKKVGEGGREVGQTIGGAVGGVVGGAVGGAGGVFSGAAQRAAEGWREHSGFSALWHGFMSLFSGAEEGAAQGASRGWHSGQNIGETAGGAVGGGVGGAVGALIGLGLDSAITLFGANLILLLFPVIAGLLAKTVSDVRNGVVEEKAKEQTRKAAQEARQTGIGPSHAEIAKDDPQHHLFKIATGLARHVDSDIGNAMSLAWEEAATSQESSPELVNSVTGLVDKYVSHPATDPTWWQDIVLNGVKGSGSATSSGKAA